MTTNYGYIDSEDQTTAHDATQWGKAANGTGVTFAAWPNSGALLVGSSGVAAGGFFPDGGYAAYIGFLEFDTTAIGSPTGATLTLSISADNGQTWNLNVAAHDWGGGSVTTADWLDPTALSALTVAGTVTSAAISAAFAGPGTIDIAIDAAAINAGGMTRLVLYSSTHAANTAPADATGSFIFDPVVAGDLVVSEGVPGVLAIQWAPDDDPLVENPTWVDFATAVKRVGGGLGRSSELDDYQTGTLTVDLDDTDGTYNPLNSASTYFGKMLPYKQVRVVLNDSAGSSHVQWRGWIEPRGWKSFAPTAIGGATATIRAMDILGLLAQADLLQLVNAIDADDSMSARFTSVLTQLGVAANSRFNTFVGTDDWSQFFQGTTYGGKALDYLRRIARSDGGAVWANKAGDLQMEQRLEQFLAATATTVQGTFKDDGTGVDFETITPDYAQQTINDAQYSREGGAVQQYTDGTSVSTLTGLSNTDGRTDFLNRDDPYVMARAEQTVIEHKDAWYGPQQITFDAGLNDVALDMFCTTDLRYRVGTEWTPPGIALVTTENIVERIDFDIPIEAEPGKIHVIYTLSSARALDTVDGTTFFRFDDAAHGFDQGTFTP